MGRKSRVAFGRRAANRVRRKEKLHALDVGGRCAVALVHVTATDPLRARRHPDLVCAAIVADRCAKGMAAMEEIVTRFRRVRAANATTGMNAVVPVKIVIRVDSIPTAIMRLKRVMRPADTGIRAGNDNCFSSEPERPHIRCVRVFDARLDHRRHSGNAGLQRRYLNRSALRKVIVNHGIAFDARNLRASSKRVSELASPFHQDRVHDVKCAMLNVAFTQPLQEWSLRALGFLQQGLIDEAAFLGLGRQIRRRAEISAISEHHKKFSLLSVCSVFQHPWRDLLRKHRIKRASFGTDLHALADSARRSNRSNQSDCRCNKEQ
jgi:hypothetical protein